MRSLALARYRFLIAIRTSYWLIGAAVACTLVVMMGADGLFTSESRGWQEIAQTLQFSAQALIVIYALHLFVLLVACGAIGRQRTRKSGESVDLTETAPVSPLQTFTGDALGIFRTLVVVHIATLPLLALAAALSPLPTSVFAWFELVLVLLLALASATTAWTERSNGRWGSSRGVRSSGLFLLLLLLLLMNTTNWTPFRDAIAAFISRPSPAWHDIEAAVLNPLLLLGGTALLYASFMAYFFLDSARSEERP